MKRIQMRIQVVFLIVAVVATQIFSLNISAASETLNEMFASEKKPVVFDYEDLADYAESSAAFQNAGYTAPQGVGRITVEAKAFDFGGVSPEYKNIDGQGSFFLWNDNLKTVSCNVDVETEGLYTFGFVYSAVTDSGADILRSMRVDGKFPYQECSSVVLPRKWQNTNPVTVNSAGDEIAPIMTQMSDLQDSVLFDGNGRYSEPLQIYLTKGRHNFSFEYVSMSVYVSAFFLDTYQQPKTYAEYSSDFNTDGSNLKNQSFEAEKSIAYTNDSVLNMTSDGDPLCSPISRGKVVMNTVGGSDGMDAGSSVTFNLDVSETGCYKIAFRALQNYRDGLPSYKMIEIDGEVPFSELKEYCFYNQDDWRNEVLSDENGNPFLFHLEKGPHTLTVTNVQSEFYAVTKILESDARTLSNLLLKIRQITGTDPDYNYDYKLAEKIPELTSTLADLKTNMQYMMDKLNDIANQETAKYNELKNMMSQITRIESNLFKLPRKLSELDTVVSQYSSWMTQFIVSPLMIDYIDLLNPTETVKSKHSNFFQNFYSTIVNFVFSFSKDYNNISSLDDEGNITKTINVWVSRGTNWATLIKRLCDGSFTPSTGIGVKMNVVTAGQLNAGSVNTLMLSIASGNAPDVCLGVATASVGEFAMRNVLTDISQLDGYEEMVDLTYPKMMIPHEYNGKVYGFPETINFWVMLYRKDILSDLKLALPDTWDELNRDMLPTLLKNNMEFYLPISNGWSLYPTLLYQYGGTLYNDDNTKCNLDTPEAFDAFDELCNFVKKYGYSTAANFFNRFRSGEMPIGIADMTTYMQILTAAPELSGRWTIAPMPGHKSSDGTVNRACLSAADTSLMLVKNSNNLTDASWEFVKWWMSVDTQTSFGSLIESNMGTSARWNSANKAAFFNMAWDKEDAEVIAECFDSIDNFPVVMGGYYTNRFINNAYNRTAISKVMDARDALEDAYEEINAELERKRK